MPLYEDVPFELKNYASPRTMVVGVTDRRTGADTLIILSGTVVFPGTMARNPGDAKIRRERIRFVAPQSPKVVTQAGQVRSMQVVTGVASFHHPAGEERTFAIDHATIDWAADLNELRITIETACQGVGSTINRVMYNAFILAQTG